MKAALLVAPGELAVGELPAPEVGPDDVEIAVRGVGLCGSDVSVFTGKWAAPSYPWVMGHEAFGTIAAVGRNILPERIGQTVVVEPNIVCLDCEQCRLGRTSACVSRRSVGMNRPGALAERLVVPSRFAWAIDGPSPEDLVCVEPTTVVRAALRRVGDIPDSVLVVGLGAQGLLMATALLERGVAVHGHDVSPGRMAFADGLGVRPSATDPMAARFELVVDTVGSPASVDFAFERLAIGGMLLLLGLDDRPLGLTAQSLVRRQALVRGSLTYDHPADFQASVAMIAAGDFAPGRIVGDAYALDEVRLAFERSGSALGKSWIRVGEGDESP